MSVGSLRTLYNTIAASALLTAAGVVMAYGEESLRAYDKAPPLVVMVPTSGQWEAVGYYTEADQDQDGTWLTHELVDFYIWAADPSSEPLDNADAVESVRQLLLCAIQQQQADGCLYRPVSGQWVRAEDELARFGRMYVLTVVFDLSIPGIAPVDATVLTVNQTVQIVDEV